MNSSSHANEMMMSEQDETMNENAPVGAETVADADFDHWWNGAIATLSIVIFASGVACADMPTPIYRYNTLSQADWTSEKDRQITLAVENHFGRGTHGKSGQSINVAGIAICCAECVVVVLDIAIPIAILVVCVRRRKWFKSLACSLWLLCALPMAIVIMVLFGNMRRERLPYVGKTMGVAWEYGHGEIVNRTIEPRFGESYSDYLKRAEHIKFGLCSKCDLPVLLTNRRCHHCDLDDSKSRCRNQDFVDALQKYCATGTDEEYIRKAEETLCAEEAKERAIDTVSNATVDSSPHDDVLPADPEKLAEKAQENYKVGKYSDAVKFFLDAANAGHRLSDEDFSMAKLAFRNRMEKLYLEIGESIKLQSRGYEQPGLSGLKKERSDLINRYYRLRKLLRHPAPRDLCYTNRREGQRTHAPRRGWLPDRPMNSK